MQAESIWVNAQSVQRRDLVLIRGLRREVVDLRVIGLTGKLLIFADGGTHQLRRGDQQLDALRPTSPRPGEAAHAPGPGRIPRR